MTMIVSLFETLEYAPETSKHLIDTEEIITDEVPSEIEDNLTDEEKRLFVEDLKEAKRLLEEENSRFGWGYRDQEYPKFRGNSEVEGNNRFLDLVSYASTNYPATVEKALTVHQG